VRICTTADNHGFQFDGNDDRAAGDGVDANATETDPEIYITIGII
jgi:hypothetical protein